MNRDVPDDEKVRNAADGIPTPFLSSMLLSKGSEQTGEDHDQIGNNGHSGVGAINSSEKAQVQQEKRRGDSPVDVSCVVDLAALQVVGAWELAVMILDLVAVEAGGVAGGHGKVRDCGSNCDERRDDMVEPAVDGNLPRHGSEDSGSCSHDDEDHPKGSEATVAGSLILIWSSCARSDRSSHFKQGSLEYGFKSSGHLRTIVGMGVTGSPWWCLPVSTIILSVYLPSV